MCPEFGSNIPPFPKKTQSTVRTIISGGSLEATDAQQNREFLRHFPAVNEFLIGEIPSSPGYFSRHFFRHIGYGMTEIVLISHMTPRHMNIRDGRRLHSVGKLLPGFEYKVALCVCGTKCQCNWKWKMEKKPQFVLIKLAGNFAQHRLLTV